ncbi:MAG: MIP/aquaporin family protein [Methanocorpusculum sp.]|nr:MIP/aquaporin family protein [Methanocorpusculum sp.]
MDLLKRSVAELVGTLVLVFIGCGSVWFIGNDLFGVAAAFGIAVAVMIYAVGSVSGAHINPAVSIALCAIKKFPVKDTIAYVIAQCIGAFIGALLLVAIGGAAGIGATAPAEGFTIWQALIAEIIGTFVLMLVIMGVAVDRRAPAGFAGLAIGGAVLAVIIAIGNISGGSINPARTFGPDLAALIFGNANAAALWTSFPIYVIGPIVGALLAVFLYKAIAGKQD